MFRYVIPRLFEHCCVATVPLNDSTNDRPTKRIGKHDTWRLKQLFLDTRYMIMTNHRMTVRFDHITMLMDSLLQPMLKNDYMTRQWELKPSTCILLMVSIMMTFIIWLASLIWLYCSLSTWVSYSRKLLSRKREDENNFVYSQDFLKKKKKYGISLVVQWLRFHASNVGNANLISGQGTKIPNARWCGQR